MHFEILVEGEIDRITLNILMEKIVGSYGKPHTWKTHKHEGIGTLPSFLCQPQDKPGRGLLNSLPAKIRGYGRDMGEDEAVVVLVDLDDREDCRAFKRELVNLLEQESCKIPANIIFRIAIEELESWFFGDPMALRCAYPQAKQEVLDSYVQDSQSGTWETMADAIYPGGRDELLGKYGKRSKRVLQQKKLWAKNIVPKMDIERNKSPSFMCFRDGIRRLATINQS